MRLYALVGTEIGMEEEDKGGTWKPVEKASLLPATKPRPAPRKRSHQPKPDITIENGKPENIPPKPAVHPKPRRPPPKAPNLKTPETVGKGVILINNNNLSADKEPLAKQGFIVNKAIKNNEIRVPKIESSVKSATECNDTSNGPVNDSADDQQWYEPLRPTVSDSSSSSDEGYEAISVPRASKITPPSQRKASGVAGNSNQVSLSSKEGGTEPHKAITTTGKASPPTSHKISGTGPKFSPPVPRKVISQGSKFSPPTPRKPIIGVASKTSPPVIRKISGFKVETTPPSFRKASETRQPEAVKDLSPSTSPRTLDPSTASNKSKPLPPKKPLPSLPKDLASAGQTTTTEANKPPVPQKPPPDLSLSSKGESSVAALAQKLSTIPVFPFRDNGSSPRPSPHPSPRPSRSQASNSPGDKSNSKPALGSVKPAEPSKPKLLPKPGGLPVKPQAGNEVQKQLPGRPSAPSAEVVTRTRSKTVESLEDNDSDTPSETSVVGTETQKKRLAPQRKTLHPVVNRSSSNGVQASRRPPPLPPGATPVTEKATVLKGPPLPPVPRPRPVSAYDHTQGGGVKLSVSKSVSMSAISNVSLAEDQSQYSYAYEHAFIGTSPPMSASSAHSPARAPTDEAGGTYETPDENVVNEFMEDIQEKRAAAGAYETADEQAVAGFVSSLKRKHTLNGLQCDLSTDESDFSDSDHDYIEPPTEEKDEEDGDDHNDASSEHSFSSDSSHDYCVPPESISPPEPPNNYGDVYDEVDDLYAEPIHKSDGEGFSSDEERDTFAEEPLYQVYTRCTLQRQRSISRQRMGSDSSDKSLTDDEAFLEQLEKGTLRNMRVLWCELPEVQESGILDNIKREERKRQEAMFEVITSEASYLRSLNILMSQFIKSEELNAGSSLCVLERGQSHVLFSNINSIKSVSENFLQALRARQKEALVISSISDIIEQHATQYFEVYVKYCSNQIYQDRTLRNLRKSVRFSEAMKRLQSRREVQGLTLQSFLVLPMQRITRLPLLVNAICQHCEAGSEEFNRSNRALAAINKIVNDCNEGARKMERMEEICVLQTQIEFKTKPLALATPSRYLLRRGDLMQVVEDSKSPLKRLKPKLKSIYMFLFNDLLLLAKKKSENRFQVLDYATRNMTQVEEPQELDMSLDHVFSLVLLENSDSKTKEFLIAANSETDKTRWMEAFKPPAAEQEGETVYASWDCPQVNALHNYTAQQPDELSLYEGDVINVLKKLPDGWYHGERLCDGTQGWFPANHTEEILNEHVRARNLRQRYRLLAASKHLIGGTLRL